MTSHVRRMLSNALIYIIVSEGNPKLVEEPTRFLCRKLTREKKIQKIYLNRQDIIIIIIIIIDTKRTELS